MPKKVKKKPKSGRQPNPPTSQRDEARASSLNRNVPVEYLDNPLKSGMDPKTYRVIRLRNGLTALLASAPLHCDDDIDILQDDTNETSDILKKLWARQRKSSLVEVGLSINVGHFSDPRQVPGIAELLSTLVPRYSKTYPLPNDRFKLVVDGFEIEFWAEATVFTFSTDRTKLRQALDRFTQCFICPLIKREDVARAIEKKLLDYDKYREYNMTYNTKKQALLNLCSARNPIKTFAEDYITGLEDVSDERVYKELLKFRERHYSANRMNFCVQARMPLDDLEEIVKHYFSAIPNNALQPRDFSQFNFLNSFDPAKFCKIFVMKELKYGKQAIEMIWVLPPSQWLYRNKTLEYIAWILNHSGVGSLSSYLKKMKWCSKLFCHVHEDDFYDNSMYTFLELTLDVTSEGFKVCKLIIDTVYSYIRLMQREGPQKRIFDEIRDLRQTTFRFEFNGDEDDDFDYGYSADICQNMNRYSPIDYLSGKTLYYEYDPISIGACTGLLTPDRANITFYDKNCQSNIHEALQILPMLRYLVPQSAYYKTKKIPEDWIESWKNPKILPELKLPLANIYCPDDFTLITVPENLPLYPVKIYSNASSEIWYKPEKTLRLPFCVMNFRYITLLPLMSSENAAMMDLFVTLLNCVLEHDLIQAREAKLYCVIEVQENGLEVRIDGVSQKAPILMQTVTTAMASCCKKLTENSFNTLKQKQLFKYENILNDSTKLIDDIKLSTLILVHWSTVDKHAALSNVRFGKFKKFYEEFSHHVYVKCLAQGNITQADVIENVRKFSETLNYGPPLTQIMPQLRFKEIPPGQRCIRVESFKGTNLNSPVRNYYQFPGTSIQLYITIHLLSVILTEDTFQKLIFEKLGYCNNVVRTLGVLCYTAEIYFGDNTSAPNNDTSTEKIRRNIEKLSQKLTDREWLEIKKIAAKMMYDPDEALTSEATFNWEEITSGQYVFDRRAREAQILSDLKVEDLRKLVSILTSDGPEMRKLSFQVVPHARKTSADSESKEKICYKLKYLKNLPEEKDKKEDYFITDFEAYKLGLGLLPVASVETPEKTCVDVKDNGN